MSSKIPSAAARIARAREEVELAETELDSVLHDIEVLPREQKRAVSQIVTDAFEKLREVRRVLAALQEQVAAVPISGPIQEPKVNS
jgi:hypothetical protein